jgi:energy-converting hydrogenase Eha subunit C
MVVSLHAFAIVVLHLALIVTFLVIGSISKIFGSARRKRPLYPIFYASSTLLALGMLLSLLGLDLPTVAIAAAACDAIALGLGAWVTWFYWEWLPKEIAKSGKA